MESYSTNFLKRKGIDQQKKKWGDVEHQVEQLEQLGIIKDTILGKRLTTKGKELQQYIIKHQCELETEIRRSIRQTPGSGRGHFKKVGQIDTRASQVYFTNYNKTIPNTEGRWGGDLAVPETVVQAKINSYLRGDGRFSIQKEDLHYYDKKSYIPIDICLLMDASGSMAGEKRQAACFLAQHLLLTGKEKVGVIVFQEHNARVVVPFTRNLAVLDEGLASIVPAGLTPMADGIMKSVELIEENRLRNPLLLMITDGVPNSPLWTMDAGADAIKAAGLLAEKRIRFVCIGIESNRIYLEKLCKKAEGALYLVDDLNKENLINIVRYERKTMNYSQMA